jgi:hypothetical protein
MTERKQPKRVLFICVENSNGSQMAEAFARVFGEGRVWIFALPRLDHYGFWSMAHEGRTDFAVLLGSIFLLIVGAGPWSIDARIAKSAATPSPGPE